MFTCTFLKLLGEIVLYCPTPINHIKDNCEHWLININYSKEQHCVICFTNSLFYKTSSVFFNTNISVFH